MYIVELAGRFNKMQGADCLIHNDQLHMPYLFNTVREATEYIKSRSKVPIYLDKIFTINANQDDIYVYKFSDDGSDADKEIRIIPCKVYSRGELI